MRAPKTFAIQYWSETELQWEDARTGFKTRKAAEADMARHGAEYSAGGADDLRIVEVKAPNAPKVGPKGSAAKQRP